MGKNIYILPSNVDLKIKTGTAGYNNKILTSDGKFSLGKNNKVNASVLEPVISKGALPKLKGHKVEGQPTHTHELAQKLTNHSLRGENCLDSLSH